MAAGNVMKIKFLGILPVPSAHLLIIQGPAIVGGDWQLPFETLKASEIGAGRPGPQYFPGGIPAAIITMRAKENRQSTRYITQSSIRHMLYCRS
jgi:hypothetical protein